jgi:hypothetical protein
MQRKFVDRAVLLEAFGKTEKQRKAIEKAELANSDDQLGRDRLADQVEVLEGWHLPSAKGAEDGRHVPARDRATTVDGEQGDELREARGERHAAKSPGPRPGGDANARDPWRR